MRRLLWLLAGAVAPALVTSAGGLLFLATQTHGFSARAGFLAKFAQTPKGDNKSQMTNVMLGGYGSFRSAWRTLQGIEVVHMIRKDQ